MIEYRKAEIGDAGSLVEIYNRSFYDDYIRYGECPAYGRSIEEMEQSIACAPKELILYEDKPIGVISVQDNGDGNYYVGCLCIIPEYQGKGIGTQAFRRLLSELEDWKRIELITPADKEENVRFYTGRCGFTLGKTEMDGNVKVVRFYRER